MSTMNCSMTPSVISFELDRSPKKHLTKKKVLIVVHDVHVTGLKTLLLLFNCSSLLNKMENSINTKFKGSF